MNKELTIVTWNLGYGVYPDYYSITGKQDSLRNAFPISKKEIKKNIEGQISILKEINADIILLQEVAKKNPVNLWTNQAKILNNTFLEYSKFFFPSINIPGICVVGKCTLVKEDATSERVDKQFKALKIRDNLFLRNKVSILTRIKIEDKELVSINIHLAPFKRQSELREQQLRYIFDLAKKEYEKENYVLIGGDWNMDMPLSKFPSKYKSIETEIPKDLLEEFKELKWNMAVANNATLRSLHTPYPNSDMSSIDGFLCSPNLSVLDVKTIPDFRYSDHCPVVLTMKFK